MDHWADQTECASCQCQGQGRRSSPDTFSLLLVPGSLGSAGERVQARRWVSLDGGGNVGPAHAGRHGRARTAHAGDWEHARAGVLGVVPHAAPHSGTSAGDRLYPVGVPRSPPVHCSA